jgi:alkyldihydroxyacetonephosphate synthase
MTTALGARKWWGWGFEQDGVDPAAYEGLRASLLHLLGDARPRRIEPVDPASVRIPSPRFGLPPAIAEFASDDRLDRLSHAYGKAYVDVMRAVAGDVPNPPDWVAYPRDEAEVAAVIAFAESESIGLIPYGGGSSVVGGIEPPPCHEADRPGVITLDLRRLDRVLHVDRSSRLAEVEAGIFGPALEASLRPAGLTLRYFPQSFEFSTVGGWIATRGSGHFASGATRIDPLVAGVRLMTPRGILDTSELGLSGAGPSAVGPILGSEGSLGVVTRAWLRVRPEPTHRASTVVQFADEAAAIEAVRALGQSGMEPADCRLLSPLEAALTGVGDGRSAELLLGIESHDRPVDHDLARAIEICAAFAGRTAPAPARGDASDTDAAASRWRRWFVEAPYLRDRLALDELVVETFETATTWHRFAELHAATLRATQRAIVEACGQGFVTWRLNNVYPDGVAPYYTVLALGTAGREIAQWTAIKAAATEAIVANGGTITHHHAVGKTHRPWFERERGEVAVAALRGMKAALDPAGIMNPGTLLA